MAYTAYKIVVAGDVSDLTKQVTQQIALGFQPLLAPFVVRDGGQVAQAVTQGTPDTGEVPSTSTVVADGATLAITNSAGTDSHNAIADVAAGAFVSINLAATASFCDNGDTVAVRNSAGADSHNGTAVVTAGVLTGINLAATVAMVDNADAITMQNSAGAAIAGTHAATVAAGVLSNVKLAATVAPITNGQALTGVAPSGVYTNTVTFAVTNGVVTGITLS